MKNPKNEDKLGYFQEEFVYMDKSTIQLFNKQFVHLEKWNAHLIQLSSYVSETFLTDIIHIHFPSLKKLYLRKNRIQSLEGLDRIYMPGLEQLWIDDNLLVFLPRMNSFTNLSHLFLSNNKLQNCQVLSQFHSPLKKLHLEYPGDPEMSPNIRWMFKLQSNNLLSTRITSKDRIKMKFQLTNKYKEIKFR